MTRGAAPGAMLSRHMVVSGQGGPKCHQGTGKLLWAARGSGDMERVACAKQGCSCSYYNARAMHV